MRIVVPSSELVIMRSPMATANVGGSSLSTVINTNANAFLWEFFITDKQIMVITNRTVLGSGNYDTKCKRCTKV